MNYDKKTRIEIAKSVCDLLKSHPDGISISGISNLTKIRWETVRNMLLVLTVTDSVDFDGRKYYWSSVSLKHYNRVVNYQKGYIESLERRISELKINLFKGIKERSLK